uniref:Basic tail secreted protein n=1 Tax=Rhipicephalus zambeziensis TaxID=60191 RepID=A0A224Y1P3_9ACAR
MTTTCTLLSLLFAIHALPNVHAYTSSHSLCYRLVPHHITAVTTPCRYQCLLLSSNVQPSVHVNYEINGTPCIIPGSHYAGRREVSHCMDGVCVQRKSSHALKRSKRACLLVGIAAWKLIKKIKEAKRRRKEMELAREAASYGGSSSEDDNTASDGGANAGAGGAYGGGRGSWPGSIGGVGTGAAGEIQGGFGGGNVGRGGLLPGGLGGANIGAGGMFPGRLGGLQGRPSGVPSYWSQNRGEGGPDRGGPTRSWSPNGDDGGMGSGGEPGFTSENFGPSGTGRFGSAYTSSGGGSYGNVRGGSGGYQQTKLN